MQALEAVMRARELLQTLTPLRRDCGGVCGAACCAPYTSLSPTVPEDTARR